MSRRPPHGRKFSLKESVIMCISTIAILFIISIIVISAYLNFTNDLTNFLSKFIN